MKVKFAGNLLHIWAKPLEIEGIVHQLSHKSPECTLGAGGAHIIDVYYLKKKQIKKKREKWGGGSAQDQVFQALLFCINYAQYLTGIHFFF